MRISLLLSLCSMTALVATCGGTQTRTGPPPNDHANSDRPREGIQVELTLSVEKYDTAAPVGTIRCVVSNDTEETVQVPASYDGAELALVCTSRRYPLRLLPGVRDPSGQGLVDLNRGQERTLFEFSLAGILQPRPQAGAALPDASRGAAMTWDWKERPMPPSTPIHVGRDDELVDQASFRAELRVRGTVIASNEVVLNVKPEIIEPLTSQ